MRVVSAVLVSLVAFGTAVAMDASTPAPAQNSVVASGEAGTASTPEGSSSNPGSTNAVIAPGTSTPVLPDWVKNGGFSVKPGPIPYDLPACPDVHACPQTTCQSPCSGQCTINLSTCFTHDTGEQACQTGEFAITCGANKTIHTSSCTCDCNVSCSVCGSALRADCE